MEGLKAEKIAVGWIDPEVVSGYFAQSMASQLRDMEYFGCAGRVLRYTAAQPAEARNSTVKIFLEETDDDWLWMVDADMMFDQGHVMKLWEVASEHGVGVVSGLAMIWKGGQVAVPSVFYDTEDGGLVNVYNHIPDKPQVVAATGLASLLVHRQVLEEMKAPRHPDWRWFDFLPNRDVGINADEMTGIDVQFCLRAREAGYPMMLHPGARTRHLEHMFVDFDTWEGQEWQIQS